MLRWLLVVGFTVLWGLACSDDRAVPDDSGADGATIDAKVVDAEVVDAKVVDAEVVDAEVVDAEPLDIAAQPDVEADAAPDCDTPVCMFIGTRSEGWYEPCTETLYGWTLCEGCEATCKYVETWSEGWYSSCDDQLIAYAFCGES